MIKLDKGRPSLRFSSVQSYKTIKAVNKVDSSGIPFLESN